MGSRRKRRHQSTGAAGAARPEHSATPLSPAMCVGERPTVRRPRDFYYNSRVSERVFQRAIWDGTPREMAAWFNVIKGQRRAVCRMFTHVFGHELRLEVSRELVASEVCRTDEEVHSCQERWRAGLEVKDWKK